MTGAALVDALHKWYRRRSIDRPVISTLNPEHANLPEYFKPLGRDRQPSNSILYLSDVHLKDLYAREWREDESNEFIKWLSIVRHRDTDIILTSQLTKLIDVQVVATLDALIIKEPSAMAQRLERQEVRSIIEEAAPHFTGSRLKRWERAFVFGHDINEPTFIVDGIKKPGWWTEELSKSFSQKPLIKRGFLRYLPI